MLALTGQQRLAMAWSVRTATRTHAGTGESMSLVEDWRGYVATTTAAAAYSAATMAFAQRAVMLAHWRMFARATIAAQMILCGRVAAVEGWGGQRRRRAQRRWLRRPQRIPESKLLTTIGSNILVSVFFSFFLISYTLQYIEFLFFTRYH